MAIAHGASPYEIATSAASVRGGRRRPEDVVINGQVRAGKIGTSAGVLSV